MKIITVAFIVFVLIRLGFFGYDEVKTYEIVRHRYEENFLFISRFTFVITGREHSSYHIRPIFFSANLTEIS